MKTNILYTASPLSKVKLADEDVKSLSYFGPTRDVLFELYTALTGKQVGDSSELTDRVQKLDAQTDRLVAHYKGLLEGSCRATEQNRVAAQNHYDEVQRLRKAIESRDAFASQVIAERDQARADAENNRRAVNSQFSRVAELESKLEFLCASNAQLQSGVVFENLTRKQKSTIARAYCEELADASERDLASGLPTNEDDLALIRLRMNVCRSFLSFTPVK